MPNTTVLLHNIIQAASHVSYVHCSKNIYSRPCTTSMVMRAHNIDMHGTKASAHSKRRECTHCSGCSDHDKADAYKSCFSFPWEINWFMYGAGKTSMHARTCTESALMVHLRRDSTMLLAVLMLSQKPQPHNFFLPINLTMNLTLNRGKCIGMPRK
jgi:hypothetical protein